MLYVILCVNDNFHKFLKTGLTDVSGCSSIILYFESDSSGGLFKKAQHCCIFLISVLESFLLYLGEWQMKAIKSLGHNAVICVDSTNRELIALGPGIGFQKCPREITDLKQIERTFYGVDEHYLDLISTTSLDILSACSEIVEHAEDVLQTDLNQNLPFILADHIAFAIERMQSKTVFSSPIAYDIKHLYAKEYIAACQGLTVLKEKLKIDLPEAEAISIAMHIIAAENEGDNLHDFSVSTAAIADTTSIIEECFQVQIDKDSYNYSRFAIHLQYLLQRLKTEQQLENTSDAMFKTLCREYPNIYVCVLKITTYFKETWKLHCQESEQLFLMLHIKRLIDRND